jgi:hypothetical protein
MSKFEREKALTLHLLNRLGMTAAAISDPNSGGPEKGIDVLVQFTDGRTVGIQVTEVDPFAARGTARANEKRLSRAAPNKPYFLWGQNNRAVILGAIAHGIRRKVQIGARHSFKFVDEVWLLICAGVPEHGAMGSTFVMTPWLSVDDMNSSTDHLLRGSKYNRCFFLPIVGVEQSFYWWDETIRWKKSVHLEATRSTPREAYVQSLLDASTQQEFDGLVAEECRLILQEMRQV